MASFIRFKSMRSASTDGPVDRIFLTFVDDTVDRRDGRRRPAEAEPCSTASTTAELMVFERRGYLWPAQRQKAKVPPPIEGHQAVRFRV